MKSDSARKMNQTLNMLSWPIMMTNSSFGLIVIDVGVDPDLAWVKSMRQLSCLQAETSKPDGEGGQIVRQA